MGNRAHHAALVTETLASATSSDSMAPFPSPAFVETDLTMIVILDSSALNSMYMRGDTWQPG